MTARLEAVGLRKSFPGLRVPVLRGADLTVGAGDAVAIVGPSGSGKSTLLALLGLLDAPDAGTVTIDGHLLPPPASRGADAIRRDAVGFVFQDARLLPAVDALGNVLVPALADRWAPTPEQTARAERLLVRLGLADRAHHLPGALSAGQRQRVAVARALLRQPAVVLADEPTAALDATTAMELVDALRESQGDAGLVIVTHDPRVASRLDRVLALVEGRLVPL